MLHVILAECAVERVPAEIADSAQIARDAKRREKEPAKMLLDSSRHWEAMAKLPDRERRARPDILHFCLLTALESVCNKSGNLKVLVHTQNDELMRVNPVTRLPRVYERFTGLLEDLYEKRKLAIKDGTELLSIEEHWPLEKVLMEIPKDAGVFVFDPKGEKKTLAELGKILSGKTEGVECDWAVITGGFAHGVFSNARALEKIGKISVSNRELAAWTALGMAIYAYESTRDMG
jgi:rRNA small subunit pseudouridine methyltransferase Nep1